MMTSRLAWTSQILGLVQILQGVVVFQDDDKKGNMSYAKVITMDDTGDLQ